MSLNKLNLQIGGPGPEDRDRRNVEREVSHLEEQIDSCIDELITEETQEEAQPLREEVSDYLFSAFERALEPPEPQLTRQERMAESISRYHTNTKQSFIQEVKPVSDTDRIQMLEDAFAQMKRGQPNTLVSGIGASLDSGGGAVWLWDLEDVNIGTPMNGQYPAIANGYVLAWDEATHKWIPEQNGGGASGDFLPLTGGTISSDPSLAQANSNGNLLLRQSADGSTDGRLSIRDYGDDANFVIFPSGSATIKGTVTFKKNDATTTFLYPDGTISAAKVVNTPLIQVTSADDADATVNLQIKNNSGNDVISSTNEVTIFDQQVVVSPPNQILFDNENYSGFLIKGQGTTAIDKVFGIRDGNLDRIADATGYGFDIRKNFRQYRNKDNNGSNNNFRIDGSTAADTIKTGFTSLFETNYSTTINNDDSMRYFGACDDSNDIANKGQIQDLIAAGGGGVSFSLQGQCDVTITPASASQPGGAGSVEQVAGYYYINNTTGTANGAWTGIGGLEISANTLIFWSATNSRWVAGAVVDASTYLPVGGGTITGDLTVDGSTTILTTGASERLIIGHSNLVGASSNPTYDFSGGKSANLRIRRATDNSMSYPQIIIEGKTSGGGGAKTGRLISVDRESNENADIVFYRGQTGVAYDATVENNCKVINYGSLVTYAASPGVNNTFTGTNIFNTNAVSFQKGLQLTGTDSTQDIKVQGTANKGLNIKCTDADQALSTAATIKAGTSTFNSQLTVANTSEATSASAGALTVSGGIACAKKLFVGDQIRGTTGYYTSSADSTNSTTGALHIVGGLGVGKNIHSDGTVYAGHFSETNISWQDAYTTTSNFTDSNSYAKYRLINGNTIQLMIRISNGGSAILINDYSFSPTTAFETLLSDTLGGAFQCVTKENDPVQATISLVDKKLRLTGIGAPGTLDVRGWTFIPYGKP